MKQKTILLLMSILMSLLLLLVGCRQPVPGDNTVSPSGTDMDQTPTPAAPTPEPTMEPTPVPTETVAQPDANTPILIQGLLIGGLNGGEWMDYDEFYTAGVVDFDGFVYDVYVEDEMTGQAEGELPVSFLTGEPVAPDGDLNELADVHLYDENGSQVVYDMAVRADWDLFPRGYESQDTGQPEYQALAEDMIAAKAVDDPVTELKQIISVDLDGDGTDEVLLTADNTNDGQFEQVGKGDNAVLIFRKMVDGQPVDQLVDSYILTEDLDYMSIYRLLYEVETCADLNGDGILEVVVKSWYYEGVTYSIYKLEGDRLIRVASNGVGF